NPEPVSARQPASIRTPPPWYGAGGFSFFLRVCGLLASSRVCGLIVVQVGHNTSQNSLAAGNNAQLPVDPGAQLDNGKRSADTHKHTGQQTLNPRPLSPVGGISRPGEFHVSSYLVSFKKMVIENRRGGYVDHGLVHHLG